MRVRLLALVNVALIPYVWARFPREARGYAARSFKCILTGRSELDHVAEWMRNAPSDGVQQGTAPG